MENRCLREFSKTMAVAMFLCALIYTGTAAFGYLTFGNLITTDILLSYEPDVSVIIAVLLIAIKMYTTYPILLFCGR
jgi:sodium-coupled neutral amino acid transporter 7/8